MGADVRKTFLEDDTPLVVDHPVLVGMLKGKKNLLYQHGEIAVPEQAVVTGTDYVFVPLEESVNPFISAGYRIDQVIVIGLCIEAKLAEFSKQSFENRIKRIAGDEKLTGAFFSSGAEPNPHLEKLIEAAISVAKSGGNAIVLAQNKGKLFKGLSRIMEGIERGIKLCSFDSREELDRITAELFPSFDYLVAPSHERTNWALGLGLPMFILDPAIGPFAPLNQAALLRSGTAETITSNDEAAGFANRLETLKESGKLTQMAMAGWGKHPILGLETIADFLINKYAPEA